MAFSVLSNLPLAFMVAGLTLLITAIALSNRARRYQRGMQILLQLSGSNLDLLDLPAAAWPALQAAGWRTLRWEGDWFGQPVHGSLGEPLDLTNAAAEALQWFDVAGGTEAHLRVGLLHGVPRGERRLFARHLAQVFVLLLETRLRERTAALSAALAERARLSLYLQHDMRNLAQWVTWVGTDFAQADTPQALVRVAQRLQGNAPLVMERAQRLMAALGNDRQANTPRAVALRTALEQAARLAGIEMVIHGDDTAWIAPELLERALDNLLSNLATDWREGVTLAPSAVIDAPTASGPGVQARIALLCPLPPRGLDLRPEKLFEPFASGRPGGLGLGLYQARHCLREAGGDLEAMVVEQQLRFTLLLPQECKKVDKSVVVEAPV
jgi:signal transduction histidine kinase